MANIKTDQVHMHTTLKVLILPLLEMCLNISQEQVMAEIYQLIQPAPIKNTAKYLNS